MAHENRETSATFVGGLSPTDRAVQATSRTTAMHVCEESDEGVVPLTMPEAAAQASEGRPETLGNPDVTLAAGTLSPESLPSGLSRIRLAAEKDRGQRFTNLMHHITPALLLEAYHALKRRASPGIDGMTWEDYGEGLQERIASLHDRVQSGRYRAQAAKRVYIPKPDGRQRPIGIATVEDKVLQLATTWVLNAIYEVDFVGFSYGFRPGRGQHDALDALWVGIVQRKVGWVLDADIRSFFDTLDHEWLLKFLGHRVADPRMLDLIARWLRAGVSEDGEWSSTTVGTPQGAVISPLLANIYLHYVFDLWAKHWRRTVRGDVIAVRYADDVVLGFQDKDEAQRFLQDLRARFAQFGLELHGEKTRLIEFGRFAQANRARRGEGKPETFAFLGFTHICARRRSDGGFTVLRKTVAKRLGAAVKRVGAQLMRLRAVPLADQGRWLGAVVRGYLAYHAVPGNSIAIASFRDRVVEAWRRSLSLRSQTTTLTWPIMRAIAARWLPRARVMHPYPNQRLVVRT